MATIEYHGEKPDMKIPEDLEDNTSQTGCVKKLKATRATLETPFWGFQPGVNLIRITERSKKGVRKHHFFELFSQNEEELRTWVKKWVSDNIDPYTEICLPMAHVPEKNWIEIPSAVIRGYPVMNPTDFSEKECRRYARQSAFKSWLIAGFSGTKITQNDTVRISLADILTKAAETDPNEKEILNLYEQFMQAFGVKISTYLPN